MREQQAFARYVRRYRRFITVLRAVSRLRPLSLSYNVAASCGQWVRPMREGEQEAKEAMRRALGCSRSAARSAWRAFQRNCGVTELNTFLYGRMSSDWLGRWVEVHGREHIVDALEAGRGLLLMTYHAHFNAMFCSMLGLMGYRVTPIAMDPRSSPLYEHFHDHAALMYQGSERNFGGGSYHYVRPGGAYVRALYRELDSGNVVVTVNDFASPFVQGNVREVDFMGHSVKCPVGSLEIAVRKQVPVAAGMVRWLGGRRFRLDIWPIDAAVGVQGVLRQYFGYLEGVIRETPDAWGGWYGIRRSN